MSQINNLSSYLKKLEKEEQKKPTASRKKEMRIIRAEVKLIEIKEKITKQELIK